MIITETPTPPGPVKKMRASEVTFIMRPGEGGARENTGKKANIDYFVGEPFLKGKMDKQTTLWRVYYTNAATPEYFNQQFTSFDKMVDAVNKYFNKRNIFIKEILD